MWKNDEKWPTLTFEEAKPLFIAKKLNLLRYMNLTMLHGKSLCGLYVVTK
jgi:hypothetical protein